MAGLIDDYLSELARELKVNGLKQRFLEEARQHLEEATAAFESTGLPRRRPNKKPSRASARPSKLPPATPSMRPAPTVDPSGCRLAAVWCSSRAEPPLL
jgi:hypothetical protein